MKLTLISIILFSFIIYGCEGKFSSTPQTPTESNGGGNTTSYIYTLNYGGGNFLTATTSNDPRATTCANANGVYLIDPNNTDTFCIKIDGVRWESKIAEFNQACIDDPDAVIANRTMDITNSSVMDTQLIEIQTLKVMCPTLNNMYGCETGNALSFTYATDDYQTYYMPGCD